MPFGNYGGPTPTMPLGSGSPAINQGSYGADVAYADQRGFSRNAQPDIGACEFQNSPQVAIIGSDLGDGRVAYGVPAVLYAFADGVQPTWQWQWFLGQQGDTSQPIGGATAQNATLPAINKPASVWVRLDYGSGYSDSATFSLAVASPIFVSTSGDDNNDGRTWATAKRSVAAAISAASAGENVWVARGTYIVGNTPLALKNGVSIYGGFAGDETRLDQRDITANPTVLTADLNGDDADYDRDGYPDPSTTADNAPTIFLNLQVQNSTIDGLTIEGARQGAVINVDSSPTISNSTFRWNSADGSGVYDSGYAGSAIENLRRNFSAGSTPKIVGCTFDHNTSTSLYVNSGTIGSSSSSATVTNCRHVVMQEKRLVSSDFFCPCRRQGTMKFPPNAPAASSAGFGGA